MAKREETRGTILAIPNQVKAEEGVDQEGEDSVDL
jgi:hypothetical protein